MIDFLEDIKLKIIDKINPENISLIDNSYLHTKHKSFNVDKYHLKLIITSRTLRKMNKIEAHKIIFSILADEMKSKIHALQIDIR